MNKTNELFVVFFSLEWPRYCLITSILCTRSLMFIVHRWFHRKVACLLAIDVNIKLRPVFTHIHTHSIHIYMCCLAILVMVVFIMYKNSNKNNIKFTIKVCACLELQKKVLANSGRQFWKEKTRLLGLQIGSFSPSVIANSHKSVL